MNVECGKVYWGVGEVRGMGGVEESKGRCEQCKEVGGEVWRVYGVSVNDVEKYVGVRGKVRVDVEGGEGEGKGRCRGCKEV